MKDDKVTKTRERIPYGRAVVAVVIAVVAVVVGIVVTSSTMRQRRWRLQVFHALRPGLCANTMEMAKRHIKSICTGIWRGM
jgi:hypothetical protein